MSVDKFNSLAPLLIDFYKTMYLTGAAPHNLQFMYSNFVARNAKYAPKWFETMGTHGPVYEGLGYPIAKYKMVVVGIERAIKEFEASWYSFIHLTPQEVEVLVYKYIKNTLPTREMEETVLNKILELHHDLSEMGGLPLEFRYLPEGTRVPMQVPFLTVNSTPDNKYGQKHAYLTNYVESYLSAEIWKSCVSASIAFEFLKLCHAYAYWTCDNADHVPYQCHDFSFRGMSGVHDAAHTGIGHLSCFKGTDTIPAIMAVKETYKTDENEIIGTSIPATEHALMCMYGRDTEFETYKHLITSVYPSGPVAIVSDTWDYWGVITDYMVRLKDIILQRDGKLVIRPDSGDPVKIICGDPEAPIGSPEHKGSIECLWNIFGGHVNDKGFKVLDSHIGLVYGDSITLERAEAIFQRLYKKGFATSCLVLGIGSYTYQMVTRDTYSVAGKTTYAEIDDEAHYLEKLPKTDTGKRSLYGLLTVRRDLSSKELVVDQGVDFWTWKNGEDYLIPFTHDTHTPFSEIRERIQQELELTRKHLPEKPYLG